MIGLELPITFKLGHTTSVLFKPSSVVLAKDFSGELSMSNRIECVVKEIDENEILAEVLLSSNSGEFYSLITKNSLQRMNIKENDKLVAMIKATEVSLGEI
jgi:molybdopterin-binding protein